MSERKTQIPKIPATILREAKDRPEYYQELVITGTDKDKEGDIYFRIETLDGNKIHRGIPERSDDLERYQEALEALKSPVY